MEVEDDKDEVRVEAKVEEIRGEGRREWKRWKWKRWEWSRG